MFDENGLIELDDGEYQFLSEKFDIMSPDEVSELPKYIVLSKKQNFRRIVDIAIKNELDENEGRLLTQKYFDNLTVTEISLKNNVSRQAVYRVLERATKKLFGVLKYAYVCGFSLLNPPENFEQLILKVNKEENYENHCS